MVSFINQLRQEGVPVEEAIFRGALTRATARANDRACGLPGLHTHGDRERYRRRGSEIAGGRMRCFKTPRASAYQAGGNSLLRSVILLFSTLI
jgi:hypothetical protein